MDLNYPGRGTAEEQAADYQPRRNQRVALSERTQMRASESAVEIVVCDLSTSGFLAECLRPVLIGSYVSLDLPGVGPVHAQVRWQVGNRLGAKFLDPISLHRCDWTTTRPIA
jgi:hypothetical protein